MSDASKTMSKNEYLKLPLSGKFVASVKYPFTDYFPTVDRGHDYEEGLLPLLQRPESGFTKDAETRKPIGLPKGLPIVTSTKMMRTQTTHNP